MRNLPVLAALASVSVLAAPQPPRPPAPSVRPAPSPIVRLRRDPAVAFLSVHGTSDGRNAAVLEFHGQVVNKGNAAFVSPPAQARVQILESRPQGGAPIVLLDRALDNLAAGAAFVLTARRPYTRNQQFPPTFSLVLSYDPDILHDGNPENDDADSSNNRVDIAGAVIDHEWPQVVVARGR